MSGPLAGVKVIELAGIGPTPFAAMLLADLGAEVLRIERPGYRSPANDIAPRFDVMNRGRRAAAIDLKTAAGRDLVLDLVTGSDALIEGFRPGVTERLGLGPKDCAAVNPRLVYGRMTGWGQEGPLAQTAGHDINYISVGGALGLIGTGEQPIPPLNLVGDFGGGGMLLALGMAAALFEARSSGKGQVVDAAIVDGTALLATMLYGWVADGARLHARGENLLDGGCHYYRAYRCRDGRWLSVGCIEPQFYAEFLAGLGVSDDAEYLAGHEDRSLWRALSSRTAGIIETRTRTEWLATFDGTDACVAPVLDLTEMASHPHNSARGVIIEVDGVAQPAPAPRFSRTTLAIPSKPAEQGQHTLGALGEWGIAAEHLERLEADGVIAQA